MTGRYSGRYGDDMAIPLTPDTPLSRVVMEYDVCVDCYMTVANGPQHLYDSAMLGTLDLDRVLAVIAGCALPGLVNGGSETLGTESDRLAEFSSVPCDLCRTPLAGARYAVAQLHGYTPSVMHSITVMYG